MTTTTELTEMDLYRLYQCSITSKYGLVDQGNPRAYERLAALDMVEKRGNGYVITTLGKEILRLNKDVLFGKRKRQKKKRFKDEETFTEEENIES